MTTVHQTVALGPNRASTPTTPQIELVHSASMPNFRFENNEAALSALFDESNDDIVRAIPISESTNNLGNLENSMAMTEASGDFTRGSTVDLVGGQPRRSEYNGGTLENLEELILRQQNASKTRCERSMKKKLRFFFMSPVEKWRKRRQFPFKLILELIKIAVVTVQLCLYGYDRSNHLRFQEKNADALRHIFQPGYELNLHERACAYCVEMFSMEQIYDSLDHFTENYYKIETIGVGNYLREFDLKTNKTVPLVASITSLNISKLYNKDGVVYELDAHQVVEQVVLEPPPSNGTRMSQMTPPPIDLSRFLLMVIDFKLHAVAYHRILVSQKPSCVTFELRMEYQNTERSGLVTQKLVIKSSFERPCKSNLVFFDDSHLPILWRYILIVIVISLSFASLILCLRSVVRSERLRRVTVAYFDKFLNRDFSWRDGGSEFLDLWLYLIIITDFLLLAGSVCWIVLIESSTVDMYEEIAILLGLGTLLSWFSILRYLNYYQKLSLLIVTLKRAAPEVLRFLLCAGVFFCGYLFFGWIVLGPYSLKFRSISSTSEQLFSLVNGDDMFSSFSSIEFQDSALIWLVSRVYLYSFIALYIYVVLSLFIAIIIDVYEEIKDSWKSKKFRPYSQVLRQVLAGTLTRQSDSERRAIYEARHNQGAKKDRYKRRKSRRSTAARPGLMASLRRFFARHFGSNESQSSSVKYVNNLDLSTYNIGRSPSVNESGRPSRLASTNQVVTIDVPQLQQQHENEVSRVAERRRSSASSPSTSSTDTDSEPSEHVDGDQGAENSDFRSRLASNSSRSRRRRIANRPNNNNEEQFASSLPASSLASNNRQSRHDGVNASTSNLTTTVRRTDSMFFI